MVFIIVERKVIKIPNKLDHFMIKKIKLCNINTNVGVKRLSVDTNL